MSSKQQIKDLFTAELINSPQYQIILAIKQIILDEIATPNVQSQVVYNFETAQSEYDLEVIKMCMILVFGFCTNNLSSSGIIIEMSDFLK
jgi:uncharacterized membrane protein YciS (DUF1049 family)